jgi:superfamily II DNA or RNA helicase
MKLNCFIKYKGFYIEKNTLTESELRKIKDELTVEPKLLEFGNVNQEDDIEDNKYKLYTNTKKYIILPKYYGIQKYGLRETKFDLNPININFLGQLRDYQIPICKKIYDHVLKFGGGLLSVPCGRGKTSMAIYIATQLKEKTLVIVHKSFLLDQWVLNIKKFTNARVGVIRGPEIDIEDKDIVIGMIQSISIKDYDEDIFKQFGFIVYDEAHHCASKVFSRSLMKIGGKYTLALSATPYRSDGLIKVMHWFLGETIYREKTRANNQVIAKVFHYSSENVLFSEKKFGYGKQRGKPNVIKMITNLTELNERTEHIVNIINEIRKDPERKIIILSERVNHLKLMKSKLDKILEDDIKLGKILENEIKTFYYIGANKRREREEAEKNADIIFATYSMAKEGLDIERLNTIILSTSQKDVNQSVGRVMRKILQDGDLRPMIIDFSDNLSAFISQTKKRKAFYKESKFIIEDYYLVNNNLANSDYEKDEKITYENTLNIEKVNLNSDEDETNSIQDENKCNQDEDEDEEKDENKSCKKTKVPTKNINFKKRFF